MIPTRATELGLDALHPSGKAMAQVKFGVDALRTVRIALLNLAYALDEHPRAHAYLVLVDPGVTDVRLREEWRRAQRVLKPELLKRISICLFAEGTFHKVTPPDEELPAEEQRWLKEVVERQAAHMPGRTGRTDFEFVVLKVLLHQWLLHGEPVTQSWLAQTAGCSYPTVSRVLKGLGSLIKRESDRRVSLRYLPREELAGFLAEGEKARSTMRFVDRSGQPRPPEAHVRRLERLRSLPSQGVAIGGVLGARHYFPSLDLVGAPRLDLSVHCPKSPLDTAFIRDLDPALAPEEDPRKPANVVVHAVRHADALFTPREGGLSWADPIECFLDLHEARLEAQATEFIDSLKRSQGA